MIIVNQVKDLVSQVNEILNAEMRVSYYDGSGISGGAPKFLFENPNLEYRHSVDVSEWNINEFLNTLKETGFIFEYKFTEILNAYDDIVNS